MARPCEFPAVTTASQDLPLVSVIVPAYNHEAYVEEAIRSIAAQTYSNIEVVIIDDGSTDGTFDRIGATLSSIDRDLDAQVFTQSNAGVCATLNRGLALAKGEFVQFLASDDVYLPRKTERCLGMLKGAEENVGAVYCDGYVIDAMSRRLGLFSHRYAVPLSRNCYPELLVANWIPAMGLLYRRRIIEEAGGFDPDLRFEDWDLLLRIARHNKILRIAEPLFLYRSHDSNLHKDAGAMKEAIAAMCKKHLEFGAYRAFLAALHRGTLTEAARRANRLNLELLARDRLRIMQRGFRGRKARRADL